MYAFKSHIKITNDRKLSVELPADMPVGDAELILLSEKSAAPDLFVNFNTWLDELISALPSINSNRNIDCSRESIYSDRI